MDQAQTLLAGRPLYFLPEMPGRCAQAAVFQQLPWGPPAHSPLTWMGCLFTQKPGPPGKQHECSRTEPERLISRFLPLWLGSCLWLCLCAFSEAFQDVRNWRPGRPSWAFVWVFPALGQGLIRTSSKSPSGRNKLSWRIPPPSPHSKKYNTNEMSVHNCSHSNPHIINTFSS